MAKKPTKKGPLKVNEFNLNSFKKDFGVNGVVKDKELTWIPFNEGYHDAIGLPGIAKGYITLFRGFSNTGKSTAAFEAMAACQKMGILPVFIDTENNFIWSHAKDIGVEFEEVVDKETGEITDYDGRFLVINNDSLLAKYGTYDYAESKDKKERRSEAVIEDVARFIDELLDEQAKSVYKDKDGNPTSDFPEICFIWDSIGSLKCFKSVASKSNNNMWNAGAMATSFGGIMDYKIPASRREGKVHTNTMVAIQKIWVDSMGAGAVKHKGGEAAWHSARMIVHMGGVQAHGTTTLKATSGGNSYTFGMFTKIKCVKNHINGIELEGKIASVSHGFLNPDKKNEYTKEYKDYLMEKLNVTSGEIVIEESEPTDEDIKSMYVGSSADDSNE